ncbi:MAG: hypothetical protein M1401_04380 [Chloroflexi bacterium]|nr:hypothetical protein [Chloroflexota bacterium]MCL5108088.1 hypothetical protein [Chloroflexota bacterium]
MTTQNPQVRAEDLPCLARMVGLDPSSEHFAFIGPQILAFHAAAARLRELDLRGVEPTVIYRPQGE